MSVLFPSTVLAGERVAIHGGSPAGTLTFSGTMLRAEVIETLGDASIVPTGQARFGDPLIADGITIWLEGFFPSDTGGGPVTEDRATTLANWDTLHAKLLTANYDLYLHYQPGDDALYRKYQSVNTVLIRAKWADPLGLPWQLAAITTNHTLSAEAVGVEV